MGRTDGKNGSFLAIRIKIHQPINMVYGEQLGATPLSNLTKQMFMFWARIKQVEENHKISSLLFQIGLLLKNVWQFLLTMGNGS